MRRSAFSEENAYFLVRMIYPTHPDKESRNTNNTFSTNVFFMPPL